MSIIVADTITTTTIIMGIIIKQIVVLRIAFSSGEGGPPKVVDEEVAMRMCDTLFYGFCLVA